MAGTETPRLVTVGQGATIHVASDRGLYTLCGAEGRGYRQSRVRPAPTASAPTCPRRAKVANIA